MLLKSITARDNAFIVTFLPILITANAIIQLINITAGYSATPPIAPSIVKAAISKKK